MYGKMMMSEGRGRRSERAKGKAEEEGHTTQFPIGGDVRMEGKIKVVYVGRHTLLSAQEKTIEKARLEIVETIPLLSEESIEELKKKGITNIVTAALPPHLLSRLSALGFDVYILKMKSVGMATTREEAEKWVREDPDKRTYLPGEKIRLLEYEGLFKVKISVEEIPVALP